MAELAASLILALARKTLLVDFVKFPSAILRALTETAYKAKRRTSANATRAGKEKDAESTLMNAPPQIHAPKSVKILMDPTYAPATMDIFCQMMA